MSLYLLINIGSLLVPFIFSFHPTLRFNEKWPAYIPGMLLSMAVFIAWDVWFTDIGVWGFNPEYLIGINLIGLPIEEWLFFICIPYACLFTYHCLTILLPAWRPSLKVSRAIGLIMILVLSTVACMNTDRYYTSINFFLGTGVLLVALWKFKEVLRSFWFPYAVITIPFLIVNGLLTGSFIKDEVVWYNNLENLGIRVGTIPIEDFIYGFSMILIPILIGARLSNRAAQVK